MTGYDVFLALLRSGLHERPLSSQETATVSALSLPQWNALLQMAGQQTVTGLLHQAVTSLGESVVVPSDITLTLMARTVTIERDSRSKREVTESLLQHFRSEGLSPLVMKGVSVADFYAKPQLRTAGDIDFYFPPGEIRRAWDLLPERSTAPDGSRHGRVDGIDIDLHERYFDLHVPQSSLPSPGTPEAMLLMLSSHILKHSIGTGVGLRQCCDMAMAYEALQDRYDPAALEHFFRQTRTWRWNRLLHAFLTTYLGMRPQSLFAGTADISPEPLRAIVLSGGNFGHYAATRQNALAGSKTRRKRDTFVRFLRRLPFSLRYAPRETIATMGELVRGNLKPFI